MDNIILQYILDLLTSWSNSFTTWANNIGDKIASIKTNTDNLPGIKADTADIKDNTAAVISPINAINSNVASVASDVGSIKTDAGIIKNNAGSIATSSGATAAYAEDIANNTLDCKNRLVTIGSDTTQIRTDSDSIAADVTEIKNTLGLYLYNTIVAEDAEGSIANFDTDLKDYLQKAVVTIPADAGGISGLNIKKCGKNLFDIDNTTSQWINTSNQIVFLTNAKATIIKCNEGDTVTISCLNALGSNNFLLIGTLDSSLNVLSRTVKTSGDSYLTITAGTNAKYFFCAFYNYSLTGGGMVEIGSSATSYEDYISDTQIVTFGSSITDGAEVDLLSGIVKINTSPVTYDSITPIAIRTYKGVNNIYSDIGDIDVTYRETLKHYLEKQN